LSKSTTQLYDGYHQLENGLSTYEQYFQTIAQALSGATQGYQQIDNLMKNLISEKPELANDNNINQTILISKTAQEQLTQLSTQFSQLTKQHQSAMQSFKAANDSLLQVNTGMKQIYGGIEKLQGGSADLSKGLNQGVTGLKQISKKSAQMESGLTQINEGQKQLYSGLNKLQGKMGELQSGLTKSTDGLSKVSSGLTEAQNYLAELSSSRSSEKFYITKEVLEGKQFKTSLDMYMSPDMRTTKMIIILDQNPYSRQAMPIIDEIYAQTNGTLSGTELSDTNIAIGGITARNVDLQHISQSDFTRTAIIMMLGIMIVLMIITRSFKNSIFIIMSLILVYFSSLGISELISKHIFGIDLLSWNVPFFSFIMIVALGVDYSIFLMMSYNELEGESSERIVKASRHIGTVVISAALILGGTFAALIPSGVLTLIQVAFVVIVGLALLSFIAMPILLPALIKVSSIQNWKLGKSKTTEQEGNITTSNDL
jgi:RND superfamily putative drug exporter